MKVDRSLWIAGIGLAAAVVVSIAAQIELKTPQAAAHVQQARRDFELSDVNGRRVSLKTFQGKWLLLFFGYTNCPDACPMALLNVSNTLKAMGAEAANLQPVFITIDSERDNPQVLKDYLTNFDGRIVGLTGTPSQIAAVAKSYETFYRKEPLGDGDYGMDHSSAFQLISPDGVYLRAFRPDDDPGEFAKELLSAMQESRE